MSDTVTGLAGALLKLGGLAVLGLVVTAPLVVRAGRVRYPTSAGYLAWRLVMRVKPNGAKSRLGGGIRRAFPIVAYVGANGGGKTLCAVYDLLPTLAGIRWECTEPDHEHTRQGVFSGLRVVWSTTLILDVETGEPHALYRPITSWHDLLHAEHAEVLLDEVTSICDAGEHATLPVPVRNLIQQMRKKDVRLRWTTPSFSNAVKRMRQVTQIVVYCQGSEKVESANAGQVWREARLFVWSVFDAMMFDEFTAHRRTSTRPEAQQKFWRPGSVAERSYDSKRSVLRIGTASDAGFCTACGGKRSPAKCECPPDHDSLPPGVVETVDARGTRRRALVGPQASEASEDRPGPHAEDLDSAVA